VIHSLLNLKEIRKLFLEEVEEDWFWKKEVPIIINVASLTKPKRHIYLMRDFGRLLANRFARLVLIRGAESLRVQ